MLLNTNFNCESGEGCSNANSNRDVYFLLASRNYRLPRELNPTDLKISKLGDKCVNINASAPKTEQWDNRTGLCWGVYKLRLIMNVWHILVINPQHKEKRIPQNLGLILPSLYCSCCTAHSTAVAQTAP